MTEADTAMDLSEQTMLAIEVSDEAIEAAACAGPALRQGVFDFVLHGLGGLPVLICRFQGWRCWRAF